MKFDKFAIIPAVATMFDANEEFDVKAQKKLVRFLLGKNVDALYVAGATGQFFLMDIEERKRVIYKTISETGGKVPTIAYIGNNDTKSSVELAKFAEEVGAEAISSVPPPYGNFPWNNLKEYYRVLTECVSIPLIMYNNTNFKPMTIEQVNEVLGLPNCAGIKYTLMNHYEMQVIKMAAEGKLLFSGVDEMISSAIITGVDGAIGSTYNFAPELFIKIREAFLAGDNKEFMRLTEVNVKLITTFFKHGYQGSMKACFELMGIGGRFLKSPSFMLSNEEVLMLRKDLRELNESYSLDFIEIFNIV